MGFRFRKSIKIAPGVKVNLGKKSVGVSVGGKYGGVSVNSRTGARARVSAPGTGLSYSSKLGGSSKRTRTRTSIPEAGPSYSGTLGGSAKRADAVNDKAFAAVLDREIGPVPTRESLEAQVQKAKLNLFAAKYLGPGLGIICLLLGLATPVFWIITAFCFYFSHATKKTYCNLLPVLEQQAAQIGAVQDDLAAICIAEGEVERANSAALYFLHLDEVIEHSLVVLEKAPALSAYSTPEECRNAILSLFEGKCAEIMQKEFEKTYKHLFALKTQKGLDSNVERFQAPYEANLDKLTPAQKSEYEEYLAKLQTVQLSPAE